MLIIHQSTPLMVTCYGPGRFRGLQLLVRKGANVNAQNCWGLTPLLYSIREETSLKPIKFLLENGANPAISTDTGATPLHAAAWEQNHSICEILLGYSSVEVNAKDKDGETPLHFACKWRNTPEGLIKLLLDHKADPNVQDSQSQAPLYEACRSGNSAAARVLLQYGADINDDDLTGDTVSQNRSINSNKLIALGSPCCCVFCQS